MPLSEDLKDAGVIILTTSSLGLPFGIVQKTNKFWENGKITTSLIKQ